MRALSWRSAPLLAAGTVVALAGAAIAGGVALTETPGGGGGVHAAAVTPARGKPPAMDGSSGRTDVVTATQVAPLRRIVLPDLLVVARQGVTATGLHKITRLPHVRDVITADGGVLRLQGRAQGRSRAVNVLGVDPSAFRSWTPPTTAANERIWAALAKGEFVLSASAQARLRLHTGGSYRMQGARQPLITLGASAPLGVGGVDALVSRQTARVLGLVPDVVTMINAPGANITALSHQVRRLLGSKVQIVGLQAASQRLPVDRGTAGSGGGRPATYLDLYKQSAARYCPGLSWTILAAIGQIESGHGTNDGPSKAGALGPMQFLPSTWRVWGIAGFGDTTADIMNPYDAVPSAARYLCASGAAAGGTSLYQAIYAYNHADWYVREVIALAQEYAAQFG